MLCSLYNVKGWFTWSGYTSEDQKASLFLVALYLAKLLYACFLYYFFNKQRYIYFVVTKNNKITTFLARQINFAMVSLLKRCLWFLVVWVMNGLLSRAGLLV